MELKKVFGITSYSYYEWRQNKEQAGFYVLPKEGKATRKRKIDPEELKKVIEETAEKFDCSISSVHERLKILKITHKKRRLPIASVLQNRDCLHFQIQLEAAEFEKLPFTFFRYVCYTQKNPKKSEPNSLKN